MAEAPAWTAPDLDVEPIVIEGNPQGLDRFPARLERLHRGHGRAEEMAAHIDQERDGRLYLERRTLRWVAGKLRLCAGHLVFRHYWTEDIVRLNAGVFCQQDKLCPVCALRRGAKYLRRYTERVLAVLRSHPMLSPYMVTETVKDGPDLRERFEHLVKASKELHARARRYRHDLATGRRAAIWTEGALAEGSVESIEIKRGSGSGQWHPHNHAIWLCPREPDQDALRAEWRDITGDSHQLHVQPFHFARLGLAATAENVAPDLVEVFKYAMKLGELSLPDNFHAWRTLAGRHFITPRGHLHGVEVPEDLADDPLDNEDLPYVEWFYRYTKDGYALENFA